MVFNTHCLMRTFDNHHWDWGPWVLTSIVINWWLQKVLIRQCVLKTVLSNGLQLSFPKLPKWCNAIFQTRRGSVLFHQNPMVVAVICYCFYIIIIMDILFSLLYLNIHLKEWRKIKKLGRKEKKEQDNTCYLSKVMYKEIIIIGPQIQYVINLFYFKKLCI